LLQDYEDRAKFLVVYIAEAHARDEWPVGPRVSVCNQPLSITERIANAQTLREVGQLGGRILVDDINDQFLQTFAAWPLRSWILQGGKVAYKAMPSVDGSSSPAYSMTDLRAALSQLV
jgi:type I thyroxine 5'-deiodinase